MFKVPQPKHDVGDVVWLANYETFQKGEPCPDCLGTKEWYVVLPNGEEFEIPCSTCVHGFDGSTGKIEHRDYIAFVQKITIASVKVDTSREETPISYMAEETGYPSGSLHWESRLFETEEEALAEAENLIVQVKACYEKIQSEASERKKKQARRKPSWEKRRIRELEKELKSITKQNEKLCKASPLVGSCEQQ